MPVIFQTANGGPAHDRRDVHLAVLTEPDLHHVLKRLEMPPTSQMQLTLFGVNAKLAWDLADGKVVEARCVILDGSTEGCE